MQLLCGFELALTLSLLALAWYGRSRVRRIGDIDSPSPDPWPKVSVVIAARNEALHLETALSSVLSLDYPNLEWVVVDDRSEDQTPAILSRVKVRYPSLKPVRVETLPRGWLGKNHALDLGVRSSSGEYLLFTDADVVYEDPSVLRKTIAVMKESGLDHGTLLPRMHSRSRLCETFIAFFGMQFMLYFRPWRVPNPKTKDYVGVGAFNLVRRSALVGAGGFSAIRMRPDDDVKLGKILKRAGYRSELFTAISEIRCEWHPSLKSCLTGLEKSLLPGFDYHLGLVALGFVGSFVFHLLPFLLVLFASGAAAPLAWATALLQMGLFGWTASRAGLSPWYGLGAPAASALLLWAILRNTFVVWRQGGIRWRGTLYSLADLKANRV